MLAGQFAARKEVIEVRGSKFTSGITSTETGLSIAVFGIGVHDGVPSSC